jgi:hypothetical protein
VQREREEGLCLCLCLCLFVERERERERGGLFIHSYFIHWVTHAMMMDDDNNVYTRNLWFDTLQLHFHVFYCPILTLFYVHAYNAVLLYSVHLNHPRHPIISIFKRLWTFYYPSFKLYL